MNKNKVLILIKLLVVYKIKEPIGELEGFLTVVSLWRLSTPGEMADFGTRGMTGTIYVEGH